MRIQLLNNQLTSKCLIYLEASLIFSRFDYAHRIKVQWDLCEENVRKMCDLMVFCNAHNYHIAVT